MKRKRGVKFREAFELFLEGKVEMYADMLVKCCIPHADYVELLGEGGEKVVILIQDTLLKQRRVLQIMLPELNLVGEKRFFRSFRILTKLAHEELSRGNVPPFGIVYQISESPAFVVMEYIDGVDLQAYLENQPSLGLEERLHIFKHIALGLTLMHQKGVVHRDIKPLNVMVDDNGRPRIIDFGLSISSYENPLTCTNESLGTPKYIAPEQEDDAANVDERADIFSLGRLMFYLFTNDDSFNPEILPVELLWAYSQATQHDPARRPATALEMLEEVAESYPEMNLLDDITVDKPDVSVAKAFQDLAVLTSVNPGKMKKLLGADMPEWEALVKMSKADLLG